MNRSQIKELVESIVKYDEFSEKDLNWLQSTLSRQGLKLFMRLLSKEIKDNNVTVSFAGKLSDVNRKKIVAMFPNKKILFKRDDANIAGGVHFQYSDFVLDYSVAVIVKRILNTIRERL
ncbi:MAG: F0F1 ATP synthase subunit delta [Endomicrobium sp.]|jgi:F-type H+-transporting ATPase subunit delta|nr:F0F1 ATP synthase subunit delta [Endomicrobium sp.]